MVSIYRKTDKGHAEIETRTHRLLPRLRQALIVVDGRKSDDELAKLILDPKATLAALLADGFIEVLTTVADRPAPAAVVAPAAAPARRIDSVDGLRRESVRYLNDKLGPAAEGIAMKLERAKSMPELRPLLTAAALLLGNIHGASVRDAFVARFLSDSDA